MKAIKETVADFALGLLSVGTSPAKIVNIAVSEGGKKGILFKTPGSTDDTPNTKTVFIGRVNVTADQGGAGGYPLAPGESLVLPVENVAELYAVATDTGQVINWINL